MTVSLWVVSVCCACSDQMYALSSSPPVTIRFCVGQNAPQNTGFSWAVNVKVASSRIGTNSSSIVSSSSSPASGCVQKSPKTTNINRIAKAKNKGRSHGRAAYFPGPPTPRQRTQCRSYRRRRHRLRSYWDHRLESSRRARRTATTAAYSVASFLAGTDHFPGMLAGYSLLDLNKSRNSGTL